ncbi:MULTISPECIES: DUF2156 domain-containing protein [Kitasatospora]|uniref:Putative VlmA homolog n=1 Tax=Kitasatospora setae (strain ATCC 33774 / DSM 43861 / JCM 3304 / KCC A-0304 / NBRC 14216 / KM-6054) TaxID=452652 RepID=E4N6A9_KITSK|nr:MULTISPECIES: DUF2156 domain-containing protein [Kitasatospora]BAJ26740.1 putative VlmA homolog [Kitasatospora setae KM-6054]
MREHPSLDYVLEMISIHAESDNPSSFLAVNEGNSYFALPGRDGVIVYRPAGRYLVQFGGPFAPASSYADLVDGFAEFARRQRRTVVGIQLQHRDALIHARHGYTLNQVGASYAVDLEGFTLAGSRHMQLRNKISRAHRGGLTVLEAPYDEWAGAVADVDRRWLPLKGEGAKPLEYLVGQTGGPMQRHRRLFVAVVGSELVGYVSYSPVYGSRPGWMHDLSRRLPDGQTGVMEAVNKAALETFREEGTRWLHFGFTPFTSLADEREIDNHSPGFSWLMRHLWSRGGVVYPAATQLAYKQKWDQSVITTEYVAFSGKPSIEAFVFVWRAANGV